jgi:hypothetical protein
MRGLASCSGRRRHTTLPLMTLGQNRCW